MWSFGDNSNGQLGIGDLIDRVTPTQIPNLKAKSVACGRNHTAIIDKKGNIWSFGNNFFGQLGLGPKKPTIGRVFPTGASTAIPTKIPNLRAKLVACGGNYTVVIG